MIHTRNSKLRGGTNAAAPLLFTRSSVPTGGVAFKESPAIVPAPKPRAQLNDFVLGKKQAVKQTDPNLFTKELTLYTITQQGQLHT